METHGYVKKAVPTVKSCERVRRLGLESRSGSIRLSPEYRSTSPRMMTSCSVTARYLVAAVGWSVAGSQPSTPRTTPASPSIPLRPSWGSTATKMVPVRPRFSMVRPPGRGPSGRPAGHRPRAARGVAAPREGPPRQSPRESHGPARRKLGTTVRWGAGRSGRGSIESVEDGPPAVETRRVEVAGSAEARHRKAGLSPGGKDRSPAGQGLRIVHGHDGASFARKPTRLIHLARRAFTGRYCCSSSVKAMGNQAIRGSPGEVNAEVGSRLPVILHQELIRNGSVGAGRSIDSLPYHAETL